MRCVLFCFGKTHEWFLFLPPIQVRFKMKNPFTKCVALRSVALTDAVLAAIQALLGQAVPPKGLLRVLSLAKTQWQPLSIGATSAPPPPTSAH
jgi:hypothetical protein